MRAFIPAVACAALAIAPRASAQVPPVRVDSITFASYNVGFYNGTFRMHIDGRGHVVVQSAPNGASVIGNRTIGSDDVQTMASAMMHLKPRYIAGPIASPPPGCLRVMSDMEQSTFVLALHDTTIVISYYPCELWSTLLGEANAKTIKAWMDWMGAIATGRPVPADKATVFEPVEPAITFDSVVRELACDHCTLRSRVSRTGEARADSVDAGGNAFVRIDTLPVTRLGAAEAAIARADFFSLPPQAYNEPICAASRTPVFREAVTLFIGTRSHRVEQWFSCHWLGDKDSPGTNTPAARKAWDLLMALRGALGPASVGLRR